MAKGTKEAVAGKEAPGKGAPESFVYLPTDRFGRALEKIRRSDPPGHERIREVMARILANPDDSDGVMTGPHHGKLKKYVGRSEYRIIYNWCASCRRANRHLSEACPFCPTAPDHSVVFHDLFRKQDHGRLGY
jgi:hypothetical protein